MDLLPYNFGTFKMCGMWNEGKPFHPLRFVYGCLVVILIVQFFFSQIISLLTLKGNIDEITEVLFISLTYATLCIKLFNFISRQDEMVCLINDFRLPLCRPQTPEEEEIYKKYSDTAARSFFIFIALTLPCGAFLLLIPLMNIGKMEMRLPYNSYQPYDVTDSMNFWITYALQAAASTYGIIVNVSMDTVAYGFMIMTTGQLQINSHRLMRFDMSLKNCIEHQVIIREIVFKVQNFFICVIIPLFFFSLVILCTSIFRMSQKPILSIEFFTLALYLCCMFYQLFFYCWFGNELELKNEDVSNAIYSRSWLDLSAMEKKNMWFVMLHMQNSTQISFHGQCGLTLDTFLWIVKTSYASFSLLKQVSA